MPTGDDHRKDPDAVARLDPLQHAVTRHDATEPAFGNRFSDHDEPATDVDVVSGEPLLTSVDTFTSPLGASRIEVRSGHADSHLGHPGHAEAIEILFDPEATPASELWEAEPEHRDYLERTPGGCTCHVARPGWRLPARTQTTT